MAGRTQAKGALVVGHMLCGSRVFSQVMMLMDPISRNIVDKRSDG